MVERVLRDVGDAQVGMLPHAAALALQLARQQLDHGTAGRGRGGAQGRVSRGERQGAERRRRAAQGSGAASCCALPRGAGRPGPAARSCSRSPAALQPAAARRAHPRACAPLAGTVGAQHGDARVERHLHVDVVEDAGLGSGVLERHLAHLEDGAVLGGHALWGGRQGGGARGGAAVGGRGAARGGGEAAAARQGRRRRRRRLARSPRPASLQPAPLRPLTSR